MPPVTAPTPTEPTPPQPAPLPPGWVWTTLGEWCEVIAGQSPPGDTYNDSGEGMPFFQGKAEFGPLYPTVRKWCTQPSRLAEADDVLVSIRAPVGPTNLSPGTVAIGRGLAALRPLADIPSLFVLYGIRAKRNELEQQATGTTFTAISADVLRRLPFPLPPLPEQRRIVARIEELFSKLDAGTAELRRTQALLKRYRQSLLHAAVTGELSREWRAANPATETGAELLARILEERRERWAQSGKKGKYKEPQGPDTAGLPELPTGWAWASVEQVAEDRKYALAIGPFGSNLKVSDYTDEGVPLVFVRNIRSQTFGDVDNKAKFVSPAKAAELAPHMVRGGEVLITKMGDPPGDACLYPKSQPDAVITSDCIKVTVQEQVMAPPFVVLTINSALGQRQVAAITQGVAQLKVSLERFKGVALPLPPLPEQAYIVSEVERRLSVLDNLEATVAAELKRAEATRQSVLHQAFTGGLVPQDPADEPAGALLERIRAEKVRAGAGAIRAGGKRGRKPKGEGLFAPDAGN